MSSAKDRALEVVTQFRNEADPGLRAELADRYGIHTDRALGVPMRRMKAIAKPLAPDPPLAQRLWDTGIYEARTVAVLVDDPESVDIDQMDRWSRDFDNWAIVDTACFHLFDKSPDAWAMVEPWVASEGEFVKRAGFALLWALALHDKKTDDGRFSEALALIEDNAENDRHLVNKAQIMALRAIGTKRPSTLSQVLDLADRLAILTPAGSGVPWATN